MKTIISFDIGIFNLAYAYVTVNDVVSEEVLDKALDKSLNTTINDWGILCLKSRTDTTKKMELNSISKNLIALLYEKFGELQYDIVLI